MIVYVSALKSAGCARQLEVTFYILLSVVLVHWFGIFSLVQIMQIASCSGMPSLLTPLLFLDLCV